MSRLILWTSFAAAVAAVTLSLMALGAARRAAAPAVAETEWLRGTTGEKLQEIERQLRGLDVAMIEVGYRFTELYFAGQDGNWDYAKYQTEKIGTALERALVRRPKRAASAAPFVNEDLPAVMEVVERRDAAGFLPIMERLRTSCMKCHVSEDVPYFTVELPEARLSSIRPAPSRAP
jgi:hypothetical protein